MKHGESWPTNGQPCMCCKKPLTHTTKTVTQMSGQQVTMEAWECTNQECITYRASHPTIPTPPLTK